MKRSKTRVILMGATPPPYMGPTIATNIILKSKLRNEFDLIHLDTSDHRELSRLNQVDFWNFFLAFKQYFALLVLILRYWPQLIYMPVCQTTLGYFRDIPFIFLSKIFGRKVICHLRGGNFKNWYSSASPLTRWVIQRVHSLVDGQIVLGENLRGLFDKIMPSERLYVVPNGADLDVSKLDKSCRKLSSNKKRIFVLFLSNFLKEKGILDVLAAVPEVNHYARDVEFIFAGKWQNRKTEEEFNRFIRANSKLPLRFLGPVYGKVKQDLFSSADIFVFPTYYPAEGHPWVIVEAMAAGLPIITTDQGAITESVKDGVNGFIVEKKKPQQIAEKIKFLICHPETRARMGAESRRMYLENFTCDRMVENLARAFRAVLMS